VLVFRVSGTFEGSGTVNADVLARRRPQQRHGLRQSYAANAASRGAGCFSGGGAYRTNGAGGTAAWPTAQRRSKKLFFGSGRWRSSGVGGRGAASST